MREFWRGWACLSSKQVHVCRSVFISTVEQLISRRNRFVHVKPRGAASSSLSDDEKVLLRTS